jgi:hypothetical protein
MSRRAAKREPLERTNETAPAVACRGCGVNLGGVLLGEAVPLASGAWVHNTEPCWRKAVGKAALQPRSG